MTLFPSPIETRARALFLAAQSRGVSICTAESCTAGLLAGAITEIAGSSAVFDRGFITYSNNAKRSLLDVPANTLKTFGAVSTETACAMAEGALRESGADFALAITGIAGPGGGSPDKPVGLVHFAIASSGETRAMERRFGDLGRTGIRLASVETALDMLIEALA